MHIAVQEEGGRSLHLKLYLSLTNIVIFALNLGVIEPSSRQYEL